MPRGTGWIFTAAAPADGSRYNMYELTAAHRTMEFGTRLLVTNLANGRTVKVTITDRGPFIEGRIIDLSFAAAQQIGMLGTGVARVRLEVVQLSRRPRLAVAFDVPSHEAAMSVESELQG